MDENTKRMMDQLKADPAAFGSYAVPRWQALMQALTRPDNGAGLQRAMQAAMRGDTNVMAELVGRVAQSRRARLDGARQPAAQK